MFPRTKETIKKQQRRLQGTEPSVGLAEVLAIPGGFVFASGIGRPPICFEPVQWVSSQKKHAPFSLP